MTVLKQPCVTQKSHKNKIWKLHLWHLKWLAEKKTILQKNMFCLVSFVPLLFNKVLGKQRSPLLLSHYIPHGCMTEDIFSRTDERWEQTFRNLWLGYNSRTAHYSKSMISMMYNMLQMLMYVCSRYKPVRGGNGGSSLFCQDNTKVELHGCKFAFTGNKYLIRPFARKD